MRLTRAAHTSFVLIAIAILLGAANVGNPVVGALAIVLILVALGIFYLASRAEHTNENGETQ